MVPVRILYFVDLSYQINGYVQLGNDSRISVRGLGTVNMLWPDGADHLKYSLIGEDELYINGFRRNPYMEMSEYPTLSALILNFCTKQWRISMKSWMLYLTGSLIQQIELSTTCVRCEIIHVSLPHDHISHSEYDRISFCLSLRVLLVLRST